MKKINAVYPKFDSFFDIGIRIGGFGLANCLFVYSRALVLSKDNNFSIINPTWRRFGIGQYIRNEKDKRHYFNIFHKTGITGIRKYYLIYFGRKVDEKGLLNGNNSDTIIELKGIGDYFNSLIPYQKLIEQNLIQLSKFKVQKSDFENNIAVHIRLGDFINEYRTPISWYISMITKIQKITNDKVIFLVFSDGSNEELKEILKLKNVERKRMKNAMMDIIAMSYCIALVGSDSTFSGWAAFLGQNYSIFRKKHYGPILIDETHEFCLEETADLPLSFVKYLNQIIS